MKTERGFTLLEVMIALAIFALLSATVLSGSQYVLRQSSNVQDRLFATWLADNQLSELRLQTHIVTGNQRLVRPFDQREWTLDQRIESAAGGRLLNVEMNVRVEGSDAVVHRAQSWVEAHND